LKNLLKAIGCWERGREQGAESEAGYCEVKYEGYHEHGSETEGQHVKLCGDYCAFHAGAEFAGLSEESPLCEPMNWHESIEPESIGLFV